MRDEDWRGDTAGFAQLTVTSMMFRTRACRIDTDSPLASRCRKKTLDSARAKTYSGVGLEEVGGCKRRRRRSFCVKSQ